MNAELLRNAWLELTPSRLLLAPVVIAAILLVVWYSNNQSPVEVTKTARFIFYALMLLWGTRRAANALSDEIVTGTWDAQRMTALGPWSMAWGKFIGGTAYVWYTALLALAVAIILDPTSLSPHDRLIAALGPILIGLAATLTSFFVVLLHLRRPRGPGRRTSFLAQAAGIVVGLIGWSQDFQFMAPLGDFVGRGYVVWYGYEFIEATIGLLTQAVIVLWLGFGVYRVMCGELQKPTWPWGWPAASLFGIAYLLGFMLPLDKGDPLAFVLVPAALVSVVLFYAALLGDGKDGVKLRWFVRSMATGDIDRAARLFPTWLFSFLLAAVAVLAYAIAGPDDPRNAVADIYREFLGRSAWDIRSHLAWAAALILFMVRDTLLVLHLNMSTKSRAPDIAAIVLLATGYAVLPLLLAFVGPDWLLAIAVPWPFTHPAITLAGPLVTLLPLLWLLMGRWRALAPRVT